MLNNINNLPELLRSIGLQHDEAKLYVQLLKGPATHLELSRFTGVNRTKVYRLADQLEKRSLVSVRTDDRGSFLVASDPSTLEVEIVTNEKKLEQQRQSYSLLLPSLKSLQNSSGGPTDFVVHTYEGIEGFKQMLWHELKAKGEALVFGSGEIEKLVEDHAWAETHRQRSVEADYTIREIINPGGKKEDFTEVNDFHDIFQKRVIDPAILPLHDQIIIYNNTVSVYHWRNNQKVGYEVANQAYADMWRHLFEHFWQVAE